MKQTAVEWLQEQLECFGNKHELQMSWATVDELLEQAKAMEKEQIMQCYEDGYNRVVKLIEDATKQNGLPFKSEEDND